MNAPTSNDRYAELVADDQVDRRQPATWEGHLVDGRHFAFTYRQGTAYLTINPGTPEHRTVTCAFSGGGRFNSLSDEQYRELFLRLVASLT